VNKIGQPADAEHPIGNLISKTEAAALAAAILVSGLAVLSKQAKAMDKPRKCDSYSYSGITAYAPSKNVKAMVSEIKAPHVYDGHIAGWVGMVGFAKGQYDQTSLQTGIERSMGQPNSWVYIELIKNGRQAYLRNVLPVKTGKPNDYSYRFKSVDAQPIDGHFGHPLDTAESLHQDGYLFKPFANSHDFIVSSPSK
jgi:hypothetical protein